MREGGGVRMGWRRGECEGGRKGRRGHGWEGDMERVRITGEEGVRVRGRGREGRRRRWWRWEVGKSKRGLVWSGLLYCMSSPAPAVFLCTAVLLRFLCSSVSLSWTCGYDR